MIEVHPIFEDFKQVAAQLAGLLVLSATGSKESTPDHPMLAAAEQAFAQASEALRRAPRAQAEPARQHHRHLRTAAVSLGHALSFAHAWPVDLDAVKAPLAEAYAHLQSASRSLPGFEIVSFHQACCGIVSKIGP